jgi:ATP-dependent 26S proteasome regulatory subunit
MKDSFFKVKKVTRMSELVNGTDVTIPESDVTFQTQNEIIQLDLIEEDIPKEKYKIKPGVFIFEMTNNGIILSDIELRQNKMLETVSATNQITTEGNKFFNKLDLYKKRSLIPKRAILLTSPPGIGKTAAINLTCLKYRELDDKTCVIVWNTAGVKSKDVLDFFMAAAEFEEVSKMIMVMEDIGGGSVDEYDGPRGVDASMLNLLDGVGNPFQNVPTFIVATTNHPEQVAEALIDRPGRFDKCIELEAPTEKEVRQLYEFFLEKELDEDTIKAAGIAAKNNFSIAHINESVTRAELDDTTILEAVQSLVDHKKKFKKAFSKSKGMSING